ncbi:hypothetical protein KGD82_26360 [Nocardiopsis eucommiae]|uniref:Uncharacterized protein n=1 Tax=Nocardiopsis eucommiae TaxID=2831970 RepID=A0A975L8L4_9ACTN|nr:hypothetical protein KGD82_26360 [Nocardiopsis eucommiae]
MNDAFDLVLPGHLRDNGGESAADHRPAPQEFRTDDPASRVDGGDGTPIRAPGSHRRWA